MKINSTFILFQDCQINQRFQYYFQMHNDKQNRGSRVSFPDMEGASLEEYMEVLFAHQKSCQKAGKYLEAETAKKRLVKVKEQMQKQRKGQMFQRFEDQKRQVEIAHLEEISKFNHYWDNEMMEYQNQAERMEMASIDKHQQELIQFEEAVEQSLSQGRRETAEMINLRKIEENLAHEQKYVEAHKVQKQIQNLEKAVFEKWQFTKQTKVTNLMSQLRNKQETELNALRQKIEQGFQQQKKLRNTEYQKLIQKYHNFMKDLENQQHQEVIKLEKYSKMQSNMSFSRASSVSQTLHINNK